MGLPISKHLSVSASAAEQANRCAVILAGGDGTRLKSLTRAIAGDERPKQFCQILGNESLLEQTRKRVSMGVWQKNIFYSLTSGHRNFYQPYFEHTSYKHLIVQPENKGTAPAILYSLLRLWKLTPDATVAFFPSDHYFSDDRLFMSSVEAAFESVERQGRSIVLLGIDPQKPETSYGWIEPDESKTGAGKNLFFPVKRFWEKPNSESARYLMERGCLWNSFVMVGTAESFLKMIRRQLPDLYKSFLGVSKYFYTGAEAEIVAAVYAEIADYNFSSEILERSPEYLRVMRVGDVGWSDLGEPTRVLGTLETLGIATEWIKAAAV